MPARGLATISFVLVQTTKRVQEQCCSKPGPDPNPAGLPTEKMLSSPHHVSGKTIRYQSAHISNAVPLPPLSLNSI